MQRNSREHNRKATNSAQPVRIAAASWRASSESLTRVLVEAHSKLFTSKLSSIQSAKNVCNIGNCTIDLPK